MNSTRHANRADRGRGDRAPRRGGFSDRDRNLKDVPSIQQVFPGAMVSIVLKVDQPTGREVQGTVSEVLTSGNHPRGIKVRLQDGRVGRVQRIVGEEEARAGSEGLSWLGRNGEASGVVDRVMTAMPGGFLNRRYGDYRVSAPDEPPESEVRLEDYVVVKSKKKKGKGKKGTEDASAETVEEGEMMGSVQVGSTTSKCPVCGEFEGDEAAVAHHVNEHFD
jgi:uncharacterized repeat protein (TIGR03833 family)